ncbi:tetratricopeptide repeat protein [Salibacteraceae bacterium]|nr:tetratricopeptide repeat protein [Salibacteraceae bacterium]MDB9709282.1 tetratricopeptide repeat protein [Salibacteraceae bacterium]
MLKFTKPFFIVVAMFLWQVSVGQDQPKIDSLFQVLRTSKQDSNKVLLLYNLSREFFNSDIDRAEKYSNRALFLSERLGYKKGIAMSYNNLGIINYYKAIYNVALTYHDRSLEIMSEIGNRKGMAGSFNNKGAVYTQQGEFALAIEQYLNSIRILEEVNDQEGVGKSYNNIGLVYYLQGNYDQAEDYYSKALEILKPLKNHSVISDIMNNLGIISFEKGEYEESLEYHFKSLDGRAGTNNQRGMATSYTNIGDVYAAKEVVDKAMEYQKKALEIQEELGDKKGMLSSIQGLARVQSLSGNSDQALKYMEDVISISSEIGAKKELRDAYNEISEIYIRKGDYKKALSFKNRYAQMKDTLFSEQTQEIATNLETKFENEKKTKEIEILQRENEIQELQLGRNRILITSFTISLVLALVSVVLYARTNRDRKKAFSLLQKQNESIKKQKEEKEVLLMEIHHRVKNNLQVINSLIRLQCAYTDDQVALDLFDECQNRIISMALIHEKMYESHDLSNVNIQEYIAELSQNLLRSYRLHKNVELDIDVSVKTLTLDTLIPLGLLLNELISNSLKHAFLDDKEDGVITVKLDRDSSSGKFVLEIGDNGIGLPNDFTFNSALTLGIELVVTLSSQLDGTIERIEKPGSHFRIEFIGLEKERQDVKSAMQINS